MAREFFTASAFCARHGGFESLKRFIELCNQYPHDLEKVAASSGMSVSMASKYRLKLCRPIYVPSPGVREYVEHLKTVGEWQNDDRQELLEAADRRSSALRLIVTK